MGEAQLLVEKHHAARRMAGAMQDVEDEIADRDLIALIEPAIGPEIAHAGHAETFAAADDVLEQIFVGNVRALDFDLQRIAQLGGAADMVDMAMRQPDLFDGDAGLLDRGLDLVDVAAGVDHYGLFGRLVPDDGAILLEQRHRNDDRAGFRLGLGFGFLGFGLGFVIHGVTIFYPEKPSTRVWEHQVRDKVARVVYVVREAGYRISLIASILAPAGLDFHGSGFQIAAEWDPHNGARLLRQRTPEYVGPRARRCPGYDAAHVSRQRKRRRDIVSLRRRGSDRPECAGRGRVPARPAIAHDLAVRAARGRNCDHRTRLRQGGPGSAGRSDLPAKPLAGTADPGRRGAGKERRSGAARARGCRRVRHDRTVRTRARAERADARRPPYDSAARRQHALGPAPGLGAGRNLREARHALGQAAARAALCPAGGRI